MFLDEDPKYTMQDRSATIKELTQYASTDNENVYSFQQRVTLHESIQCVKIASRIGGKVFGGFVREIVVPMIFEPDAKASFKDIDIWFKTKEQADEFIRSMGNSLYPSNINEGSFGSFTRHFCCLRKYLTSLTSVDVIVSKELPVNDFDVNTVTYSLTEDDQWVTDSPEYLVEQIKNKRATILPTYIEKIKNSKESDGLPLSRYQQRIERIFLNKGWTVYYPEIFFSVNANIIGKIIKGPVASFGCNGPNHLSVCGNKSSQDITKTSISPIESSNNKPVPAIYFSTVHNEVLQEFIIRMVSEGRNDVASEYFSTDRKGKESIYRRIMNDSREYCLPSYS